jgi:hypothetical protein
VAKLVPDEPDPAVLQKSTAASTVPATSDLVSIDFGVNTRKPNEERDVHEQSGHNADRSSPHHRPTDCHKSRQSGGNK